MEETSSITGLLIILSWVSVTGLDGSQYRTCSLAFARFNASEFRCRPSRIRCPHSFVFWISSESLTNQGICLCARTLSPGSKDAWYSPTHGPCAVTGIHQAQLAIHLVSRVSHWLGPKRSLSQPIEGELM